MGVAPMEASGAVREAGVATLIHRVACNTIDSKGQRSSEREGGEGRKRGRGKQRMTEKVRVQKRSKFINNTHSLTHTPTHKAALHF